MVGATAWLHRDKLVVKVDQAEQFLEDFKGDWLSIIENGINSINK